MEQGAVDSAQECRIELALDFESFVGRALPRASWHHFQRHVRPLWEQALVLVLDQLWCHMLQGQPLHGSTLWLCKSLVPLGGLPCVCKLSRPTFVAHGDMQVLV